ncbi:hypothetical protein BDR04DRAFT_879925 [Suillus decipiens]|nr:hypothetical protein BDR04DRAFT_879925 [Suillus decipiens]
MLTTFTEEIQSVICAALHHKNSKMIHSTTSSALPIEHHDRSICPLLLSLGALNLRIFKFHLNSPDISTIVIFCYSWSCCMLQQLEADDWH